MKMTGPSSNAGFSLAELIGVVVIIAILAAGAVTMFSGVTKESKKSLKASNAAAATRLLQSVRAAGGETATAPNLVNTTSPQTILASLNTGVTVAGITFKLTPSIVNTTSYVASGTTSGWDTVIVGDGLDTTEP